jgi:hypothetical protein
VRSKVVFDDAREIAERDPSKEAPIVAYASAVQQMQFNAEVERQAGTENYKNAFNFSRDLAFKTLDLTKSIKHGLDGPSVDLTAFMETFSKTATQIVKSIKEVDMGATIDAWDDRLGRVRTMTMAEHMLGAPLLAGMGLIKEDGTIDIEKINKMKTQTPNPFARWMMAAMIAGEMQLVREYAYDNLAPRQSFAVVETILQAMERISGGKDERGNWIPFFDHAKMKFIRQESKTELWRLYKNEILLGMLFGKPGKKDGLFSGLAQAFGIAFKYAFQGALS